MGDYYRVRTTRRGDLRGRYRVGIECGAFGTSTLKSYAEHVWHERLLFRLSLRRLRKRGVTRPFRLGNAA